MASDITTFRTFGKSGIILYTAAVDAADGDPYDTLTIKKHAKAAHIDLRDGSSCTPDYATTVARVQKELDGNDAIVQGHIDNIKYGVLNVDAKFISDFCPAPTPPNPTPPSTPAL